jgi:hypothetical protein
MTPGLKITFEDMIEACRPRTKVERREEIVKFIAYCIKDLDDPEQSDMREINKRLIETYMKELNELDKDKLLRT